MAPISRRGVIRLASSLLPRYDTDARAEPSPNAGPIVFNIASFAGAGDTDAAFAKAIAAIEKAAAEAVGHGPTMEDCSFADTSDDAENVHGFYYYVVAKTAPQHYRSPRNGISSLQR